MMLKRGEVTVEEGKALKLQAVANSADSGPLLVGQDCELYEVRTAGFVTQGRNDRRHRRDILVVNDQIVLEIHRIDAGLKAPKVSDVKLRYRTCFDG